MIVRDSRRDDELEGWLGGSEKGSARPRGRSSSAGCKLRGRRALIMYFGIAVLQIFATVGVRSGINFYLSLEPSADCRTPFVC